jgi:hypothetical protein
MISDYFTFSTILSIFIELCLGYFFFFILGYLILIPGKNKLLVYKNKLKTARNEIKKVRNWFCLGWTILVIGFHLYIIFL